jgi:predicted N-formylglutamate amidohydrolase
MAITHGHLADRELDHALIEVRNDMIRQIEDEKTKRELGKPPASRWGPV